jgi:hypothetical protein
MAVTGGKSNCRAAQAVDTDSSILPAAVGAKRLPALLYTTNLKHCESFHKDCQRIAITTYVSVAYNEDFERSSLVAAERSEAALGGTEISHPGSHVAPFVGTGSWGLIAIIYSCWWLVLRHRP